MLTHTNYSRTIFISTFEQSFGDFYFILLPLSKEKAIFAI